MGIKTLFKSFTNTQIVPINSCSQELKAELFYKELAINSCINLIANTITKSEFKTFEKGKEVKKQNYYKLNVEPNQNQNASSFWREIIYNLVYNNECLVVMIGENYYVADGYNREEKALTENIYTNVGVKNYTLSDTFLEHEVLFFQLHNKKIKSLIDNLYAEYGKLIKATEKNCIKNSSRRGKLQVPADYPTNKEAQDKLRSLFQEKFKKFFEADGDAVVPLTNGITYDELPVINSKSSAVSREVRALIDDIFDFVALAFNISPVLLKGSVADTEKALNNTLTFGINPIAELINNETNRKIYKQADYLNNTYCRLDTSNIQAVDIKDVANALDVLVRIGAFTVDDCLNYLGKEKLNTDWSDVRFMTKNYTPIETMLNEPKGGVKNE